MRAAGDDVHRGAVVFGAGTVVTPAVLGVLASINARAVRAFPRARVSVLSTGDELVTDGSALAPGQIRETNQTMLAPLLAAAGCVVSSFGVVPDDEADAGGARCARPRPRSDAVVTSGGVSMGDYDVVKAVLGRIAEMRWMQVAIKPAKPFAFGTIDGVPVFGLPGNPVSSLVSFEMFARPALRRMMGHTEPFRPSDSGDRRRWAPRRPDGKVHLVRVVATFADDGRLHVEPVSAQGSHQLAATALANALAIVDDGDGIAPGGDVADHAVDLIAQVGVSAAIGRSHVLTVSSTKHADGRSGQPPIWDIDRAGRTKSTWLMWWPAHLPATARSMRAAS